MENEKAFMENENRPDLVEQRERWQKRHSDATEWFNECDAAVEELERIIPVVEDLTNKYADMKTGHKEGFHKSLLKSVGTLIALKEFFKGKRRLAEKARTKAGRCIKHLDQHDARVRARNEK